MKNESERKIFYIGNSRIEIVPPQITEEERQARLKEIQYVCWYLWMKCMNETK
ncbi:hypothetical protein [Hazenella coriacea]|uniref:Uncharacterized protein n=1 Tax=Hazenella coriacea TaxID=1179467 RepID=A0A4R3L5D1_9BACL|nr:hypothetical protein [Hazenella coriacea]TCS95001.1 hypothetical protein EDD58_103426 [Hazenella coriacea]